MAELRPAQPTPQDAQAFASLYKLTTFNMMHQYLGPNAYTILEKIFLLPHHEHSYDVTTFGLVDNVIVGSVLGYTAAAHDEMGSRTLQLYARYGFFGLLRSIPSILRLRPLRAVTGEIPSDAYYVKGLAIDPAARGKGIGRMMMEHVEQKGLQAGCKRSVFDVRTTNVSALKLFESWGYKRVAKTPDIVYQGETFGFHRVEKPLV